MRLTWKIFQLTSTLVNLLLCGCTDSVVATRDIRQEVTSPPSRASSAVHTLESSFSITEQDVELPYALTAKDAAKIALANNAQFKADLTSLKISEADVLEAGLLKNPRIDLLVGIDEKPFEFLLTSPAEILWQRPRRLAVAKGVYEQVAFNLVQNGLDVIRDAKLLHADVILAEERLKFAKEAEELLSKITKIAEIRLRAGDIPQLEFLSARAELGAAKEQRTRLTHDLQVAFERMRNVLGLPPLYSQLKVVSSTPSLDDPSELPALIEEALSKRPDLRAAELNIETAFQKINWERSRFLSLVAALISVKEVGTHGLLASPGVAIDLPIFNHNQGQISRAEAELQQAVERYLSLKQKASFEVAESRAQLIQALETYKKNRSEVITVAEKSKEQAIEQFERGEVAYLFVLQQSRSVIDAEMRAADLRALIKRSVAQLERNTGGA